MRITAWLIAAAVFMGCLPCSNAWPGCAEEITILPEGPTNAVDIDGNLAAIGNGRLLKIVDLSDPANPVVLGSIVLPGEINEIDMANGLALVATGRLGLQLVVVSEPWKPILVGSWGGGDTDVIRAILRGDLAFVLTESFNVREDSEVTGLHILDIAPPEYPVLLGSYGQRSRATAFATGNTGYVFLARQNSRIVVVDITDPTNPTWAASFWAPYTTEDMVLADNTLYATDGYRFSVFDVTRPMESSLIAQIDVRGDRLSVSNGVAYFVGERQPGMRVVDVQNASGPQILPDLAVDDRARDVAVWDDVALVAGGGTGTWIVDVTDPREVSELTRLDSGSGSRWITPGPDSVLISDRGGDGAPYLIQRSLPFSVLSTLPVEYVIAEPAITDSLAFVPISVSTEDDEIVIFDVSNPAAPLEVSHVQVEDLVGLATWNTWLYVADQNGLKVIDVAEPEAAAVVGSYPIDAAISIAAEGRRVVLGQRTDWAQGSARGLWLMDVSTPTAPRKIGFVRVSDVRDMAIRGSTLFALAHGIFMIYAWPAPPSMPEILSVLDPGASIWSIDLSGRYAYLSSAPNYMGGSPPAGLWVVDVGNLYQPRTVAQLDTAGLAYDVAVIDGVAWIADGDAGLVLADVSSCGIPPPYEADGRAGP